MANRCYARMAEDPSTDKPGCKGIAVEGGTKAKEPRETDPTAEVAAVGRVPKTRKPEEGAKGGVSIARVPVTAIELMMGSRLTMTRGSLVVYRGSSCT